MHSCKILNNFNDIIYSSLLLHAIEINLKEKFIKMSDYLERIIFTCNPCTQSRILSRDKSKKLSTRSPSIKPNLLKLIEIQES